MAGVNKLFKSICLQGIKINRQMGLENYCLSDCYKLAFLNEKLFYLTEHS